MRLSKREIEVAELIAWGASDKEIAEELFISLHTVTTHRKNIRQKLGAHNSQDITRWYFQYKQRVFFGFNPRQVRHIAWTLLILIISLEVSNMDALRATRTRVPRPTSKTTPARRPARAPRQTHKLEYA